MLEINMITSAKINWWLFIKSRGCNNFHTGKRLAIAEYKNKKQIQKFFERETGYFIPMNMDMYNITRARIDSNNTFFPLL